MKYLKRFENIEYKKYIICDDIRQYDILTIYEVRIIIRNKDVILTPKFSYYNNKLETRDNMIYYGNYLNEIKIYDQSDNIDELIEKLPYISEKEKYNI